MRGYSRDIHFEHEYNKEQQKAPDSVLTDLRTVCRVVYTSSTFLPS